MMKRKTQTSGRVSRPGNRVKKTLLTTAMLAATTVNTALAVCTPTLYGTSFIGKQNAVDHIATFYSINPANGQGAVIGSTGFDRVSAMDFDPATGILYATAEQAGADTPVLISINRTTGAGSTIGTMNLPVDHPVAGMSIRNSDSVLYGYGGKEGVFTVDKSNGSVTTLELPIELGQTGNGIAFSSGDVLYHADSSDLHTVNQVNGLITDIGDLAFDAVTFPPLTSSPKISGMDFGPETGLYYAITKDGSEGEAILTSLNVATGVVTTIGPTADSMDGIAYFCEPAPASIELEKDGAWQDNGITDNVAEVGETISYTFTIQNSGGFTLTNVDVTDTVGGVTVNGGPLASLAPDAIDASTFTGTYAITQADIDSGSFFNTARVCGTAPSGSVCDPDNDTVSLPRVPAIQLVKTGTYVDDDGNPGITAGDHITYVFAVTNTGNVTLAGIDVTDTVGGVTVNSGSIASLAPGNTNDATISGSYTITQGDINSGSFSNTAQACGAPPTGADVCDEDTENVALVNSAITLIKSGTLNDDDGTPGVSPGDSIDYTFTVTNTGNVNLTGIELSDTIGGVTITGGPIGLLTPGASDTVTFTGSYDIIQADITAGHFLNTATVCATPPAGPAGSVCDDDDEDISLATIFGDGFETPEQ